MVREVIDSLIITTAGQHTINQKNLSNVIIPLPPLAEQKRIVAKVDELMALCDELEAAEKELDALESHFAEFLPKSILQDAVQGKLVPQDLHDEPASELLQRIQAKKAKLVKEGKIKKEKPLPPIAEDEIPYELPDGWVWCRLGEPTSLLSGRDLDSKQINENNEGIPYITGASAIYDSKIIVNRWTKSPMVVSKKRDVLLSCKGTVGKIIENVIGDCHIARQIMAIRLSHEYVEQNYVSIFLMSYVQNFLVKAKSIIPGISREDVLYATFPLPPLTEQKRIVAKVDELMALCEELKTAKDVPAPPLVLATKPRSKKKAKKVDPIGMAARGKGASKPSAKLQQVIGDLFDEDE